MNSPKAPKKMVRIRDGTMPERRYGKSAHLSFREESQSLESNLPTAAIALGNVNIPLLTISAIMKNATYYWAHVSTGDGI